MAELHIDFSPERLTLDMLIEMEEAEASSGRPSARFLRDFFAGFVVDEDGGAVDVEEARALVGKMNMAQLNETMERLSETIDATKAATTSGEASGS